MKKAILSILLIAIITYSFGQKVITGKVIDAQSSEPIIGAIVEIPELNRATSTDTAGNFRITIPSSEVKAQISYLGYKTQIINLSPKDKHIIIKLHPSLTEIEQIVVTAGYFSDAHTNAIKVQTINPKQLPPVSTDIKFLTFIPGIDLVSKGNAIVQPVIRGLSGTNILVLKEGFRLENFQFSQNHPFMVNSSNTSKVEIIKGPASLLYGSDAIGGVINFLWEKPAPINKIILDYNLEYFSNGYGLKENFGLKASSDKIMWGAHGTIYTQSDFFDAAGNQVKNSRFNIYDASGFFIFNAQNSIHKFFAEASRNKIGLPVTPILPLVTDNSNINKVLYQDLWNIFIANKNEFFIGNNTKLTANLSFEDNSRGVRPEKDKPLAIHMKQKNLNYELKLSNKLGRFINITGIQGFYTINNNDTAANKIIPDFIKTSNAAFTLIKWQANNELNLQTGLRYEMSSVIIPRQEYYDLFGKDTSLKYNNLSASVGATFDPNQALHIKFNVASGFRMPNMAELTQYGIHAYRFEQGNLLLKPQRSLETDFSVHYHVPKLMIDICPFYNHINNYIYLSPTNEFTSDSMRIYRYMQSDATIYGYETGLAYYPSKKINFKANFSYIIGKQADTSYLPLMPQNKIRLWMTWNMLEAKKTDIKLTINYIHAFAQNHIASTEDPSPAYNLWNAYISTVITAAHFKWHLSLGCENIFNEKYSDHLSTLKEAGFYDIGRNFVFRLSIPIEQNY